MFDFVDPSREHAMTVGKLIETLQSNYNPEAPVVIEGCDCEEYAFLVAPRQIYDEEVAYIERVNLDV